jgi:hypothetical protein
MVSGCGGLPFSPTEQHLVIVVARPELAPLLVRHLYMRLEHGQGERVERQDVLRVLGLAVQPDPQRADRLEAMTGGGHQVITVLVADHRQRGEQPVHRFQYDRPGRVRAVVQREDIGDSDHLVAAARHRSGDHPAASGLSGKHEGGRVVEQFGPEEVRIAVPVVPGERLGMQRARVGRQLPIEVRRDDGRTRRAVDPLRLEQHLEAGLR